MKSKNAWFSGIIMALGIQSSAVCMCATLTPFDVSSRADDLRSAVLTQPLGNIKQRLDFYLEKYPALIPDIFWCSRSPIFNEFLDNSKDLILFYVVNRASEYNDHEQILDLIINTLSKAYWHKRHTQDDINKLVLQWLWTKNRAGQYFLEDCIVDSWVNNDIKRKVIKTFIGWLQHFAKPDEPVWMLASTAQSGHIIYAHCEDLFKNDLGWLSQFKPQGYSSVDTHK